MSVINVHVTTSQAIVFYTGYLSLSTLIIINRTLFGEELGGGGGRGDDSMQKVTIGTCYPRKHLWPPKLDILTPHYLFLNTSQFTSLVSVAPGLENSLATASLT